MNTTIAVTTILADGTPHVTDQYVGDVAQKHVLRTFNVTNDPKVDMTKVLCAALIQQMIDLRESANASNAQKRAASIAIIQIEQAQMQAVKANFVQA
jgi:hypothetical protein